MVALRRHAPEANPNRYFVSARDILLVRFDPGTRDKFSQEDIKSEDELPPDIAEAVGGLFTPEQIRIALEVGEFVEFTKISPKPSEQSETGPLVLSSKFRQALTAADRNIAGAVARTPSRDGLSRFLDLQPIRSTRRVNGWNRADELDLSFSWKALPFDSRLIRAILVFHYEGTTSADAFGTGEREQDPDAPIPTGFLLPATGRNLKFIGLVDEIDDAHDESGDSISMRARDMTALLLDRRLPSKAQIKIPPGATIQTVVQSILALDPEIRAIIRGPFVRGRVPQLEHERYHRLMVSAKERKLAERKKRKPAVTWTAEKPGETTFWDAIKQLCFSHEVRPTMELDRLVLFQPRVIFKTTPEILTRPGEPAFPRPGGHRANIGDTQRNFRRMVYGLNINNVRFHRKLGRVKAPAVIAVGYDPDAPDPKERTIEVKHPPGPKIATNVDATGKKATQQDFRFTVDGVIDPDQLRGIAEQVYEEIGRQELGVTFSTDALASHSDHPLFDPNEEPDLLDLKPGDPIQLLVTPTERERSSLFSLTELGLLAERVQRRAGAPDPVEFLKRQGFKEEDARQLARLLATANLPSEFRVNAVSVSFDGEGAGGFTIQVDMRNYVVVRADPKQEEDDLGLELGLAVIERVKRKVRRRKALKPEVTPTEREEEVDGDFDLPALEQTVTASATGRGVVPISPKPD